MNTPLKSKTEICSIPRRNISELGNILQIGNGWRDIMALVPKIPWIPGEKIPSGEIYPRKYTSEDIGLVADACSRDGRTGLEVLIEEWGTSGRIRPKVTDLINLFNKADFERASLYLQKLVSIIGTAGTPDNTAMIVAEASEKADLPCDSPNDLFCDSLSKFNAASLHYNDILEALEKGNIIGKGAFGEVYKTNLIIEDQLKVVAVKLLIESQESDNVMWPKKEKIFQNEIEILSLCNHENIIRLEGYSCCKNNLALVYAFMENGSLFDRISLADNSAPLPWKLRLKIALGIAEGIVYLHTAFSPPMIHRDIKSPNVLLDINFVPKLGDFGIVRTGAQGVNAATVIFTTPIGTQMYMAPEAFRGDVSVKMDTFSYAIVILELLTGLPFFDTNRESGDILSHVQNFEEDDILLVDTAAGEFDARVASELFEFSETCTKDKRERPSMVAALDLLRDILSETNLDE